MENRSHVYSLDIRLWSVALQVLDAMKAAGIDCGIAEPKQAQSNSVRFLVRLNNEITIDEQVIATAEAIVARTAEQCTRSQGAHLVANKLVVYVRKPNATHR